MKTILDYQTSRARQRQREVRRKDVYKLRQRVRNKISGLCSQQKNRCFWCKNKIIRQQSAIRAANRENGLIDPYYFYHKFTDRLIGLASIDHVVPLGKGGTNERSNLVAACTTCNHKRSGAVPKIIWFLENRLWFITTQQESDQRWEDLNRLQIPVPT